MVKIYKILIHPLICATMHMEISEMMNTISFSKIPLVKGGNLTISEQYHSMFSFANMVVFKLDSLLMKMDFNWRQKIESDEYDVKADVNISF